MARLPSIGILLPFLLAVNLNAFTSATKTVNRPRSLVNRPFQGPIEQNRLLGRTWRRDAPAKRVAGLGSATGASGSSEPLSGPVEKCRTFASKNFFLLGMFVAVGLARAFPALGKNGGVLRPELFIGKFGVTLIFLLSGLSLELSELKKAASNVKLNSL